MRTSSVFVAVGTVVAMAGCGVGSEGAGGGPPGETAKDAGGQQTTTPEAGDDTGTTADAGPDNADDGGNPPPVTDAGKASDAGAGKDAGKPPPPGPRLVAYLPNYAGSYSQWATSIDFSKMTHLLLAFATATSSNGWDMGASDSDVKALVNAAHAAGVKVIPSLGGGGGDQSVIAQYNDPNNVVPLVKNLDAFVAAHDFDGVDIDVEDPNNLGARYSAFVNQVVTVLRPKGKSISAAVAQYLQSSMEDATLHQFDFLNDMAYQPYSGTVSEIQWYVNTKKVPASKMVAGAAFFGQDSSGNEYPYSQILQNDSSAWNTDQTTINGTTVTYMGVPTMKKTATWSKGYGGIMFWDLSEDVTGQDSLYGAIQSVW
jgi:GH18 family chitinase